MNEKKPQSNSGAYGDVVFRYKQFTVVTVTVSLFACQEVTVTYRIAVIELTAYVMGGVIRRCPEAGMNYLQAL